MSALTQRSEVRLRHVESHLEGGCDLDGLLNHVRNGSGNVAACLLSLAGHAEANAMQAWFRRRDLAATRDWFRQAATLVKKRYAMGDDTFGPGAKMFQLMNPLIANDEALIEWFAHCDAVYDMKRVQDHCTMDFLAYQAMLALRGEWRLLEARCDKVLADPPRVSALQKYQVDQRFYLGLARDDEAGMLEALQQILQPRALAARSNDGSGYTDDLISTPAVIFTKLAWRRGLRIVPQSPLVPAEWLPIEALPPFVSAYGLT